MKSLLTFSVLYCIKQIDSMLPSVCSVADYRRRLKLVRTSVTQSPNDWCWFLFLPHSESTEQTHGKMESIF